MLTYHYTEKIDPPSKKKMRFSNCEIEVLLNEVDHRKSVLFGSLSTGVTNKNKQLSWQFVAAAVNEVSSTPRSFSEIKKKWSDMKVDSKKRIAEYRQSVLITGGGSGKPPPSPLDERVAGIIGEKLLSGIVPEDEGDTDAGK